MSEFLTREAAYTAWKMGAPLQEDSGHGWLDAQPWANWAVYHQDPYRVFLTFPPKYKFRLKP